MAQAEQIPILLMTGFLGAGKTTLLANWLKAPDLAGALVIVNELGEVGLDHRLLETSDDTALLLENGCLCCAAQEDLIGTLERKFWDRHHKRTERFGWVLIETTGMADPLPVIAAIKRHTLVGARYRVAGVVTVVDAKRGLARLADFPECRHQLAAADVVIVTKTDLATSSEIAAVEGALPDHAPHAKVVRSANGTLDAGELLALLEACATCGSHAHDTDRHEHAHAHGHLHAFEGHAHAVAEHADGVSTAFLPVSKPVSWGALIAALATLIAGHADTLLRLKGIVRLAGAPGFHAVQATPGQGITRAEVPIDEADDPPRTGFTLIVFHEPAAGLASSLAALIEIKSARAERDAAASDA